MVIDETLKDKLVLLQALFLFALPPLIAHDTIAANEDDLFIFTVRLNQAFFLELPLLGLPLFHKTSHLLFQILQQALRSF